MILPTVAGLAVGAMLGACGGDSGDETKADRGAGYGADAGEPAGALDAGQAQPPPVVADGGAAEASGPNWVGPIPYEALSEYGFFRGPLAELNPSEGVVPFVVRSPLWADNAHKGRFLVLPPGKQIEFAEDGDWGFPEGTIIVKTFYFSLDRRKPQEGPFRIVETRLLIREADAWRSEVYIWNAEQTEAERYNFGKIMKIGVTNADGLPGENTYIVPNTNQCANCHEVEKKLKPLGPVTLQMNRMVEGEGALANQLAYLTGLGLFANPPENAGALPVMPDPMGEGDLHLRARSYLVGNCAHCHQPGGSASASALILRWDAANPVDWGVCKHPVAAGAGAGTAKWVISPGYPEDSILLFRINSTDPDVKMPELPNLIPDDQGVGLIREWIAAGAGVEPTGCD